MISLNTDEDLNNFQRRNVELVKFPPSMYYKTYEELGEKLDELEGITVVSGSICTVGPFSSFKLNESQDPVIIPTDMIKEETTPTPDEKPLRKKPRKSLAISIQEDSPVSSSNIDTIAPSSTPTPPISANIHDSLFSKTSNSWVHYELLDYAKLTILAIKGTDYKFNEQNMLHILYPKFFPNLDSDDWFANAQLVNNKLYKLSKTSLEIFPLFPKLLNEFTSDIFSFNRMIFSYNYFDIHVMPAVKKIIGEFVCYDFTSWDLNKLHHDNQDNQDNQIDPTPDELITDIKLAIIDLVLGLAAFKYSCKYTKSVSNDADKYHVDEYLRISIELRKLSITIINYHLDEYDNNSEILAEISKSEPKYEEYESLLIMALIFQIELDCRLSVFENLELIFAIGDYIIKNKLKHQKLTNFTKFLIQVFKISHIFYESTQAVNIFNYSISKGDEEINYRDLNENYDLISMSDGEDDDEVDDDDDDDDEDDNYGNQKNGRESSSKKLQIKPTINNLVISNTTTEGTAVYEPMSFTVSFNKRKDSTSIVDEPDRRPSMPKSKAPFIPTTNQFQEAIVDINAIYMMYGIPKSLLDLFHEIIHLTNHKNMFRRWKVFPRNFPKICAEIEDRLINWKIADSNWELDSDNNAFHKCLELNILSFHCALIVYYNRLIKDRTKVTEYQQYITQSVQYLEQLIQLSSTATDFKVRPLFWTLLVCGADSLDTTTQKTIQNMWKKTDNYALQSNYWRAKQILYEVWKRRKIGEDLGFMDMVREWDIVLYLG
ncbi:ARG83 [[Candida] subhashii]|uniref:ARG83 n=1 Tax=[Candida] subhashii TaxID=561895 RepID=A0A8J5QMX1_9ASCO|nr:ARG83 [[Candida] subhashii]KAG7664434.1 ARG83 [[Candida] subhashii]